MKPSKAGKTKAISRRTMRKKVAEGDKAGPDVGEGEMYLLRKSKPKTDQIPEAPTNKEDLEVGKVYNVKGTLKMWNSRQWRKVCTIELCARLAVTGGTCKAHGGGLRCSHQTPRHDGTSVTCAHSAVDKNLLCKAHGGGRRCMYKGDGGCDKSAAGNTDLCKTHGGGVRCHVVGCHNSGVSPSPLCIRHGGGMRCSFAWRAKDDSKGRTEVQRSDSGLTVSTDDDADIVFCRNSARGGTGFCVRHGDLGQCVAMMCLKEKTDKTNRANKFCADHENMHERYGALGILGETSSPSNTTSIKKTVGRKKRPSRAVVAASSSSSSGTLLVSPSASSAASSSSHAQPSSLSSPSSSVSASEYAAQSLVDIGSSAPLSKAGAKRGKEKYLKRKRDQDGEPTIGNKATQPAMIQEQQHQQQQQQEQHAKRLREAGHYIHPQFVPHHYPYPAYQTYPPGSFPMALQGPPVGPQMLFASPPSIQYYQHQQQVQPHQQQQQQQQQQPQQQQPLRLPEALLRWTSESLLISNSNSTNKCPHY